MISQISPLKPKIVRAMPMIDPPCGRLAGAEVEAKPYGERFT